MSLKKPEIAVGAGILFFSHSPLFPRAKPCAQGFIFGNDAIIRQGEIADKGLSLRRNGA